MAPRDQGGAPYPMPEPPLSIDDDGDIVDAHGWLVAVPAHGVWEDRAEVAGMIRNFLNHALSEHQ